MIELNPVTRNEGLCFFLHFDPLGLRCKMIVMPLDRDSGPDRVVSEL